MKRVGRGGVTSACVVAAVVLGVVTSGAAAAAERGRILIERSSKKSPDWIARAPESERYLYSVGIATGAPSLEEGRTSAALDAVEDVVFYLSLRATARYEQRRTHLATEVLDLIETTGSAELTGGRAAELYFERYAERSAGATRQAYDVYVLFRVPLSEIEAERSRILNERAEAKRRAAAVVRETSVQGVAADFIGGLSDLAAARREVVRAAPGAAVLASVDARIDEIAARARLALESVAPAPADERRRQATASVVLVGESGPLPVPNVPLEFEVAQGAERESARAVTGEDGIARVTLGFPLDPFHRALVQVRIDPALLPVPAEGTEQEPLMARFDSVQDYRVVHLAPAAVGQVDESEIRDVDSPPSTVAEIGPKPEPRPRVAVFSGQESAWAGRRNAVVLPVLVQVAPLPTPTDAPPPLNLALVLDCSDSMHESGSWGYVREAASIVVRSLGREDVLSIVTYGERPSVLVPAQGVAARRTVLYELARLTSCGRSNLGGGIERALEEIGPHIRPGSVSRLMVLTDGRVNEGATDDADLARLAAQVVARGATLSAIGLGTEVNHELLERLVEAGGGRFAQAASVSSLPGIFALEIGNVLSRRTEEFRIALNLAPDASLLRAYGYPVRLSQHSVEVLAGSLPVGESRSILLDLEADCSRPMPKWVGSITVRYREPLEPGPGKLLRQDLSVSCTPGHLATHAVRGSTDESDYVDLYARLARAADTLEFVLYDWDPRLLAEMESFLADEQPQLRREVGYLDDPELLDLVRFIDRGALDMWEGVARLAESIRHRDPKRFPDYRLYKLRHWNTQLKN